MPWKEISIMSQRHELVSLATTDSGSVSALARQFGVSRKTAYKWIRRYRQDGREGLHNQSTRPQYSPKITSQPLTDAVLRVRDAHPSWGGRKIAAVLRRQGYLSVPAPSTITGILHRHHRIRPEDSVNRQAFRRFEHPDPNDLWQMDFKGDFKYRTGRCHPLTILDDHSRYSLCLAACDNEKAHTVRAHLINTFRRYGLPYRMTMDNGAPWGSDAKHQRTRLTVWLMRLGIRVSHSRPYHPQTQGKDERFHKTLKTELLSHTVFYDLLHCQTAFDEWRQMYNTERPHEALGQEPPLTRYRVSDRQYPEVLPQIEYDTCDQVRQVTRKGVVSYQGKPYRVGKAFIGYPVAIRDTGEDHKKAVYFCNTRIKMIDLSDE